MDELTILPANEASWDDLAAVFGTSGDPGRCFCQRYRMAPGESWRSVGADELAHRLRQQTECGNPGSGTTSGILARLDGEPVGWCAVAPRSHHRRLLRDMRVPWEGREEVRTDETVWAATCLVVRKGFRRRRISYALASGAVDFARARGARALEGYPMTTTDALAGELHVGTEGPFLAAGLREVSRPSARRAVLRIDF